MFILCVGDEQTMHNSDFTKRSFHVGRRILFALTTGVQPTRHEPWTGKSPFSYGLAWYESSTLRFLLSPRPEKSQTETQNSPMRLPGTNPGLAIVVLTAGSSFGSNFSFWVFLSQVPEMLTHLAPRHVAVLEGNQPIGRWTQIWNTNHVCRTSYRICGAQVHRIVRFWRWQQQSIEASMGSF